MHSGPHTENHTNAESHSTPVSSNHEPRTGSRIARQRISLWQTSNCECRADAGRWNYINNRKKTYLWYLRIDFIFAWRRDSRGKGRQCRGQEKIRRRIYLKKKNCPNLKFFSFVWHFYLRFDRCIFYLFSIRIPAKKKEIRRKGKKCSTVRYSVPYARYLSVFVCLRADHALNQLTEAKLELGTYVVSLVNMNTWTRYRHKKLCHFTSISMRRAMCRI